MIDCLPELYKLICLIVTIPDTVSVEKNLAKDLMKSHQFYDDVIDFFAQIKERRIHLNFKNL